MPYNQGKWYGYSNQKKGWGHNKGWGHADAPDENEDQDSWKKGGKARNDDWGSWKNVAPEPDYTGMDSEADTWRKRNELFDRQGGGQCADDDARKNMRQDQCLSVSTQPADFEPFGDRGIPDQPVRSPPRSPRQTAKTPPGLTFVPNIGLGSLVFTDPFEPTDSEGEPEKESSQKHSHVDKLKHNGPAPPFQQDRRGGGQCTEQDAQTRNRFKTVPNLIVNDGEGSPPEDRGRGLHRTTPAFIARGTMGPPGALAMQPQRPPLMPQRPPAPEAEPQGPLRLSSHGGSPEATVKAGFQHIIDGMPVFPDKAPLVMAEKVVDGTKGQGYVPDNDEQRYGQGYRKPMRTDFCAGDSMPALWKEMDWKDIWRGNRPGCKRPAVDTAAIKLMLRERHFSGEVRHNLDKKKNKNNISMFVIGQCQQQYILPFFKNPSGGPVPWCGLCGRESWGPSHIFSNRHLENAGNNPYRNPLEWHKPPTFRDLGLDDPQDASEGITFATIPADMEQVEWPVEVRMPSYSEALRDSDIPHFESRIPDNPEPEWFSLEVLMAEQIEQGPWQDAVQIERPFICHGVPEAEEQPHTPWQNANGRQHFPSVGTIHSPVRPPALRSHSMNVLETQVPQMHSIGSPALTSHQIGDPIEPLQKWMDNIADQTSRTKNRMRNLQKDFAVFSSQLENLLATQSGQASQLENLLATQSGQDHVAKMGVEVGTKMIEQVAKFNGQMQELKVATADNGQVQSDLIHRISQGLQELKVATAEMRVEERVDELRAQLTDDLQTKIDMVLAEQIDCQKSVCQNLNAIRQECMQDQLSTMRTNVNFFKFMATAQLKQRQPEPACGCFKFLMRGKTKAVTQPQPEPDFIAEHEQLIEDLARKFDQGAEHMSRDLSASLSGEGGGSFFGASLSGKGGGKTGGDWRRLVLLVMVQHHQEASLVGRLEETMERSD